MYCLNNIVSQQRPDNSKMIPCHQAPSITWYTRSTTDLPNGFNISVLDLDLASNYEAQHRYIHSSAM